MSRGRGRSCWALLGGALALVLAAGAGGETRDDTAWLQAKLDAGGTVELPKLPDGQCYATRGLWVSHDDTVIESNGGCIVSLGPGEVRLTSADGDPIAADAVFYINRSTPLQPAPDFVTIRGLTIEVPAATRTYGIAVLGHDVLIQNVTVTGAPVDDLYIGDRANGDGYASRVTVDGCRLENGGRNVVSAVAFLDLTIRNSVLARASNGYARAPGEAANPSAGLDIEPNTRGNLVLGLNLVGNVISDNAGPGILFELASRTGRPFYADRLTVARNKILRNGRGGIVFVGGQANGGGRASVRGNTISGNGGAAIVGQNMGLAVDVRGNDLSGNGGGAYANVRLALPRPGLSGSAG